MAMVNQQTVEGRGKKMAILGHQDAAGGSVMQLPMLSLKSHCFDDSIAELPSIKTNLSFTALLSR